MMSKNKLKEIDIKDRTSYYFDQIILKAVKKSCEEILTLLQWI